MSMPSADFTVSPRTKADNHALSLPGIRLWQLASSTLPRTPKLQGMPGNALGLGIRVEVVLGLGGLGLGFQRLRKVVVLGSFRGFQGLDLDAFNGLFPQLDTQDARNMRGRGAVLNLED